MVVVAADGLPTLAPDTDTTRIWKASSLSATASVSVETTTVFDVSPAAKVSEPEAAT